MFSLGNELQLGERTWLSSGLSFIDIKRKAQIEYTTGTNTSEFPNGVEYTEHDIAPRLGLRYQLTPEFELFGNVSRSIDPPVTWQLGSTGTPTSGTCGHRKATRWNSASVAGTEFSTAA